ncbi:glycosyltransferase family A protein [Tatumella ptyseos]|uniref:glycosyltransferase family A protein n=1 Tax=Tatumella ptyseos TaxID=82987 RepID=UPI000DBE7150|nr:glycosyltransferase family A protein [Tatumella ptyseos]
MNGSGARNKGVEISSGKYIALLDADDTWHEDKLLRYNEEICRLDKKDIIFYSKLNVMQDGCKIKEMPVRPLCKSVKKPIASYLFGVAGFIQTSTIVVHRDTYLKVNLMRVS